MNKEKDFGWLDAYTQLLFWFLLVLLIISIVTTIFSPYLDSIKPYSIDLPIIYVFILLIIIPISRRIISFKYDKYEINLAAERKEKNKKEFVEKFEPIIPKETTNDNKLRLILENKQYFEGFGYYYKKIEEIIRIKLIKNKVKFQDKEGLGYLFKLASINGLIDSMSQKKLALFIEARTRFVHSSGEFDLNDEQVRNLLILASHLLNDLRVGKNG